jgi:hypothetical protein
MNIAKDDDNSLDNALGGPLLDVPEDFTAHVMAALPARPLRTEPRSMARGAWRALQVAVLAVCGALGAVEAMLFLGGLWAATAVAVG